MIQPAIRVLGWALALVASFSISAQTNPGAGLIVNPNGFILSNCQLVEGAEQIEVILPDSTRHTAKVFAKDKASNLVLLKIRAFGLSAAALGDSDRLTATNAVMAIGFQPSSDGAAALAPGRMVDRRKEGGLPLFRIDAGIGPGYEGGPLVNESGEVIGVILTRLSVEGFLGKPGVPARSAWAVPINSAKALLKENSLGWPKPAKHLRLPPSAILESLKPSLVRIVRHGLVKSEPVQIAIPGLPKGALPLEFVPMSLGAKRFLMSKYEVTQAQYQTLMRTNPSEFRHTQDCPVENVSWNNAQDFCRRLAESLGRGAAGWPEGLALRLPTDEEWSLAVGLDHESGSTPLEKDGKIKDHYPWGSQWPPPAQAGNYCDQAFAVDHPGWTVIEGYEDGYADTAPVGSFTPNQFGLYDMGGNVWEWCEDYYDPATKLSRVLRGASWANHGSENLLSSARNYYPPIYRYGNIGFRIVLAGAAP